MKTFAYISTFFCLLIILSSAECPAAVQVKSTAIESSSLSESSDSITTISPVHQDYGVGHLGRLSYFPDVICVLESTPTQAMFGTGWDAYHFAWVIWDLSVIPTCVEIVKVEIEHELDPHPIFSEPRYRYVQLKSIYLPPPDWNTAHDELNNGTLYLDVDMGDYSSTRRYDLYEQARIDVAEAVAGQTYFSIGFLPNWNVGAGWATIPGWNESGPRLIVTWRRTIGVTSESWGSIKSLYSD